MAENQSSINTLNKQTMPTWKIKYASCFLGHSWEECPICHANYYRWCVKNRYCGQCGHDYSYYRPCNQARELNYDFMMLCVYGCRKCSKNQDLDKSFICKQCSTKLSQAERLRYILEVQPKWEKMVETRTLENKRNQEASWESWERYPEQRKKPYLCGNFCNHCGQC